MSNKYYNGFDPKYLLEYIKNNMGCAGFTNIEKDFYSLTRRKIPEEFKEKINKS
jgi:hypothetical protein